jgi:hypothetical protein
VVYGYDNAPRFGTSPAGEPVKSHTDYTVNSEQVEVVRAIFEMYADGHGLKTIAKTLNADPSHAQLGQERSETSLFSSIPVSPSQPAFCISGAA